MTPATAVASVDHSLDAHAFFVPRGAQSLLAESAPKPSYALQAVTAMLYIAAIAIVLVWGAVPRDISQDEPLELVMLPAAAPPEVAPLQSVDETPVDPPPRSVADVPPPPPPEAVDAVAPVEPPAPEVPPPADVKPPEKPVVKPVEHKVVAQQKPAEHREQHPRAASAQTASREGPTAAAEAQKGLASGYANQVHSRIERVAVSNYPQSAMLRRESGRVGYRIVIGPSGELISKSITSSSGNAALDGAVELTLSRCAPYPATGQPKAVSLNGTITFRLN